MTSSESDRLDLYNGLQEALGTDRATTLMSQLHNPDLLTRSEFNERLDKLDARFDRLEDKLDTGLAVVNQRIDRVLLAVVAGLFLLLAAIIAL
jgi:hypothetical protein